MITCKDPAARDVAVKNYKMARLVRRQLHELLTPLSKMVDMKKVMEGVNRYNFTMAMDSLAPKLGGREIAQYLSHVLPAMHNRLNNIRAAHERLRPEALKSKVYTEMCEESRWAFLRVVREIRPTASVETVPGCRTEIVSIRGGGSSVTINAKISPAWVQMWKRIGFSTVQDRYVLLAVEETYEIDDGLKVHRARALDLSKLCNRLGYVGVASQGDMKVTFFAEEMSRAISIAKNRMSGKMLDRLSE